MTASRWQPDPKLDLVLDRNIDVPPELVWEAWTKPAHLKKWLTPLPWITTDCEVDLRPGGIFRFTMRSPEGKEFPHTCCYLEVVPGTRLVWTDALLPGYRPAENPFFTAVITFAARGAGTQYTATATVLLCARARLGPHHDAGVQPREQRPGGGLRGNIQARSPRRCRSPRRRDRARQSRWMGR